MGQSAPGIRGIAAAANPQRAKAADSDDIRISQGWERRDPKADSVDLAGVAAIEAGIPGRSTAERFFRLRSSPIAHEESLRAGKEVT